MSDRVTVESPEPTLLRSRPDALRVGFTLLAAAAVLEAVARLLAVPWYDDPDQYVNEIVTGRAAHYAGTTLSFIAAVMIAAALTRLAAGVTHGAAGPALTLAQAFPLGLGAVASVAFFAGSFGRDNPNSVGAAIRVWEDGIWGGSDFGWYAAMLGGLALAVATAALVRRRLLRRIPGILIGIGAVATGVTSQGPVPLVLAAAALVLAAGAAWAAAGRWRSGTT